MKHDIKTVRHSLAHILAMAILKRDPHAKLGTGPATDDGFFYDVLLSDGKTLSPNDFGGIIEDMRAIVKADLPFERKVVTPDEARGIFADNPFKLEIIGEAEMRGEEISVYTCGDFADLCAGPHVERAGDIDAQSFTMKGLAGAYWRGDESNPMLIRVSGYAFADKKALEAHFAFLEEAKKRDHRRLGKELDLFAFSPLVGPGLPLFTPRGTAIKETLQREVERICRRYGFEKVFTPHLAKIDLYETSGHKQKFGDELFHVASHHKQDYVLKPVQCPHHTQIYASRPRSYRDLPIRYMESEKQYRDEKPGEINGLQRVIAITVEDGHTFCTPEQVKDEIRSLIEIIRDFYTALGMWENKWVSLSVRDRKHPENYIGEPDDWDLAERTLREIADELGLDAKTCEGEAALYGPKIDFMFRDATGREVQIPTVQLDFATPKRFGLVYTASDGSERHPIMIHRAILGSYERFMMLLIEHFAGAFPFWLAPVQVRILPIGETHREYARDVAARLKESDIRIELDDSDESLGKKIRNVKTEKIPYFLVIGDAEVSNGTVTLESRDEGKLGELSVDNLLARFGKESTPRI